MSTREDWLEKQLENVSLSVEKRTQYESELDAIAARIEARITEEKAAKVEAKRKWNEVITLIESGDDKAITAIAELEFGNDYEVMQQGDVWITRSKVAKAHHAETYEFDTFSEGVAKRRNLTLHRLYNKYNRNGLDPSQVGYAY